MGTSIWWCYEDKNIKSIDGMVASKLKTTHGRNESKVDSYQNLETEFTNLKHKKADPYLQILEENNSNSNISDDPEEDPGPVFKGGSLQHPKLKNLVNSNHASTFDLK